MAHQTFYLSIKIALWKMRENNRHIGAQLKGQFKWGALQMIRTFLIKKVSARTEQRQWQYTCIRCLRTLNKGAKDFVHGATRVPFVVSFALTAHLEASLQNKELDAPRRLVFSYVGGPGWMKDASCCDLYWVLSDLLCCQMVQRKFQ